MAIYVLLVDAPYDDTAREAAVSLDAAIASAYWP